MTTPDSPPPAEGWSVFDLLTSSEQSPTPSPTPTTTEQTTSSPPESPPPQPVAMARQGQTDLSLPIETLYQIDPNDLTQEQIAGLIAFYRAQRLNFAVLEQRPKQLRQGRGPMMTPKASVEALDNILDGIIGGEGKK